jgi:hypothetical protein
MIGVYGDTGCSVCSDSQTRKPQLGASHSARSRSRHRVRTAGGAIATHPRDVCLVARPSCLVPAEPESVLRSGMATSGMGHYRRSSLRRRCLTVLQSNYARPPLLNRLTNSGQLTRSPARRTVDSQRQIAPSPHSRQFLSPSNRRNERTDVHTPSRTQRRKEAQNPHGSLCPICRSEQFRLIFPMAQWGRRELKEIMQLGCVAAVSPSLCSDDASRPLIRPIPSARAAVAATESKP